MRIEQQQPSQVLDILQQIAGPEEAVGTVTFQDSIIAKRSSETASVNVKDATYLKPGKEEDKTLVQEMQESTGLDAADRKNQMVVLAGTTSEEDYREMQEEGFSLDSTTTNTIVTVTDKIKAQLAKAGVDISCFGDDLDLAQIEAITGSAALAMQLAEKIASADLPVTEEGLKDAAKAYSLSMTLGNLDEGAIKYILDNSLAPTIENLYLAEFGGSVGYREPQELDISSFSEQVERVIVSAGLKVNEDTMADSKWLVENDIPLTQENLQYMEALKNTELPLEAEKVMEEIALAVAEGRSPKDAVLVPGYSLMAQAEHAMDVVNEASEEDLDYIIQNGMELTVKSLEEAAANRQTDTTETTADADAALDAPGTGSVSEHVYTQNGLNEITARRQLEEARLAMTVQANYALLKKGIAIDTEPLAQLIDQLKANENEYYVNLLQAQGVADAEEKASLLLETTEKVAGIKSVPVYVLGIKQVDVTTIEGVNEAGLALKEKFEQANQRYETLMMAPSEEMGDSIQKAFRNVDDILKEIGLSDTEVNRRAVRILAYNQTEITAESVMEMRAADEEVQRAFKNMTPAVVIRMIKEGINPLEMDFTTLNRVAEQIKAETGDEDKSRFSEYLWKLEQNHQISEEERSSYIGIYRLIRQVENTDGAAIGALVNQGAPVTMKNLLTAIRTEQRSGRLNISVDDSYGMLERVEAKGISITEQIEAAYQFNCLKDVMDTITPGSIKLVMEQNADWRDMTPEQLKAALERVQSVSAGWEQAEDIKAAQSEAQAMQPGAGAAQPEPQAMQPGTGAAVTAAADMMRLEEQLDAAYAREQLADLKASADVTQDIYEVLEKYDIPNTVANVFAVEAMMKNRNRMFGQIFGKNTRNAENDVSDDGDDLTGNEVADSARESLLAEFADAVSDPVKLEQAQEKLNQLAEKVIEQTIDRDDVTSLDVREMKLLHTQLSVCSTFVKEEQYSIPVVIENEIVNLSLKIVRGTDTKGIVDVTMEQENCGKIAATFQAKEGGVSGLVASDRRETKQLLEGSLNLLKEQMESGNAGEIDIHYAYIDDLDLNHFSMGAFGVEADFAQATEQESGAYQVQTTRLYHIAESFVCMVRTVL